jgi:hypothetical protein
VIWFLIAMASVALAILASGHQWDETFYQRLRHAISPLILSGVAFVRFQPWRGSRSMDSAPGTIA